MICLLKLLWVFVLCIIGSYISDKIPEKNHYVFGYFIGSVVTLGLFIMDLIN